MTGAFQPSAFQTSAFQVDAANAPASACLDVIGPASQLAIAATSMSLSAAVRATVALSDSVLGCP